MRRNVNWPSRKVPSGKMPKYSPIILSTVQSKYGYWNVKISIAPGLNVVVMVASLGVSEETAGELALAGLPPLTTPARYA